MKTLSSYCKVKPLAEKVREYYNSICILIIRLVRIKKIDIGINFFLPCQQYNIEYRLILFPYIIQAGMYYICIIEMYCEIFEILCERKRVY